METLFQLKENFNLKPLGQEHAWGQLQSLFLQNKLAGSFVFSGPKGIGKKTTALAFFQWVNCERKNHPENLQDVNATKYNEACGNCSPCIKTAKLCHLDLTIISPRGEQIVIEDLREMQKTMFFAPLDNGRFRLIVIDDAHKLNHTSANSLLKILEEPPHHTRFVLVTHEPGLLLPTIASRCQFLAFSPLSEENLSLVLKKLNIEFPQDIKEKCLNLLSGGVENACFLAQDDTIKFLRDLEKINLQSWQAVVSFADSLSTQNWKMELFLDNILLQSYAQAKTSINDPRKAYKFSEIGMNASYLRDRLSHYANKKLIALACAKLGQNL